MHTFQEFPLATPLHQALGELDFHTPTPIQHESIPKLLDGHDLLGIAQTGTGKTAAFVLPMLHRLVAEGNVADRKRPRALILVPTRELAVQVDTVIHKLGRHLRLPCGVVYGGVRLPPQRRMLQNGVEVLVATPGRLRDHLEQGNVFLDDVEVLVLDEADRMLDVGFLPEIKRIAALLPKTRQNMLFSATMPKGVADLVKTLLNDPVRVEIAPESTTVERIEQRVMMVDKKLKRDLLRTLLHEAQMLRGLVFTRTKFGADKLAKTLSEKGVRADSIHGNRSQSQRERALQGFRTGKLKVLVATDVASRGIDVTGISHVFNYELPDEPESYVHRIGRTARAGADGIAVSLCAPDERKKLKSIEHVLKQSIPVHQWTISKELDRPTSSRSEGAEESRREDYSISTEGFEKPARWKNSADANRSGFTKQSFESKRPERKRFDESRDERPRRRNFRENSGPEADPWQRGRKKSAPQREERRQPREWEGERQGRRTSDRDDSGFRRNSDRFGERSDGFRKERSFGEGRGSFRNRNREDDQRGNSRDSRKFDHKPAGRNWEDKGDFKRFERKPSDQRWDDRGGAKRFERGSSDRRFERDGDFPRKRFERDGEFPRKRFERDGDFKPRSPRFERDGDFKPRSPRFERDLEPRERRSGDFQGNSAWKPRDWSKSTGRKHRRG